jgi:ribosomal protein S18 acetylase RimI-like enzyme
MKSRPYAGPADVAALQRFMAETWAASDGFGCLHPGDIPHHLFSGNKLFDPTEFCTIWEDDDGIAAFLLANATYKMNDLQIRPDLRTKDWVRELVVHGESELLTRMALHGIESDEIYADCDLEDTVLAGVLEDLGYVKSDDPPWVVNRADLTDLEDPEIPDGYTIRQVESLDEAGDLALVHSASFASTWTEDMYRTLMQTPGYAMEHEWVAIAADGEYAAFTVTWRDHLNRTGLFEPVGTHENHRRIGLGKALLLTVLHAMADEGLDYGIVCNSGTNPAAAGLYQSAGFRPWRFTNDWVKRVPAATN